MVVAHAALLMNVEQIKAQLAGCFGGAIMPSVILPLMVALTRYARQVMIANPNKSIKSRLRFFHVFRLPLERLLALASFRLKLFDLLLLNHRQRTLGAANLLQAIALIEWLFARLAFFH